MRYSAASLIVTWSTVSADGMRGFAAVNRAAVVLSASIAIVVTRTVSR